MEYNSVTSGYPKSIKIIWVDGLSKGPPGLRRHKLSYESYLTLIKI